MPPLVSLIVPILADREAIRRLLPQIRLDLRVEVIVAEAGNEPGLEALGSGRPDIKLLHTSQGRGRQMNAAAGLARGDWLLFLHADSTLPSDWLTPFEAATRSGAVGGWFRFAVDDPAWQARVIEKGVALRVRLLTLPYGDQGLFVRRRTFADMGGYKDLPLLEDVDFIRRLASHGPVVEVPCAIATSPRRWKRDGWFRRSVRNLVIIGLYYSGVSPQTLARWY